MSLGKLKRLFEDWYFVLQVRNGGSRGTIESERWLVVYPCDEGLAQSDCHLTISLKQCIVSNVNMFDYIVHT